MKKKLKQICRYPSIALFVLMMGMTAHVRAGDNVKIIQIVPDSLVMSNVESEITVEVEYNLESKDEGVINLGFNTRGANAYVMGEGVRVKKGRGKLTLKAKVKPVDWRGAASFYAYVNISEHPHAEKWEPLASKKKKIKLKRQ